MQRGRAASNAARAPRRVLVCSLLYVPVYLSIGENLQSSGQLANSSFQKRIHQYTLPMESLSTNQQRFGTLTLLVGEVLVSLRDCVVFSRPLSRSSQTQIPFSEKQRVLFRTVLAILSISGLISSTIFAVLGFVQEVAWSEVALGVLILWSMAREVSFESLVDTIY